MTLLTLSSAVSPSQDEHSFQPVTNLQGFDMWELVTQGKKEVVAARKRALSEEHTIKQNILRCSSIVCETEFSTGNLWSSVYIHCTCWLSQNCNFHFLDKLNYGFMLIVGYFTSCNLNTYLIFFLKLNLTTLYYLEIMATKLPASEGYSLPRHCKRHSWKPLSSVVPSLWQHLSIHVLSQLHLCTRSFSLS